MGTCRDHQLPVAYLGNIGRFLTRIIGLFGRKAINAVTRMHDPQTIGCVIGLEEQGRVGVFFHD